MSTVETILTSDEEDLSGGVYPAAESEDEGCYPFRRNKSCNYFKVKILGAFWQGAFAPKPKFIALLAAH